MLGMAVSQRQRPRDFSTYTRYHDGDPASKQLKGKAIKVQQGFCDSHSIVVHLLLVRSAPSQAGLAESLNFGKLFDPFH